MVMVQSAATKRSLSPARRQLIEWMQNLNFGRVEGLQVREGEPVVECPPRMVREIKFGGEFGPRPEVHKADFLLKAQVLQLFAYFDEMGSGRIDCIEVKNGLPFKLTTAA
jgi:hypothetical protein